jgi:hypothetical protein
VHLAQAQGQAGYLDFSLPAMVTSALDGEVLRVEVDRPARVVVFRSPPGRGLRQLVAPVRSNDLQPRHALPVGPAHEFDFYIGVISGTGQSILSGPVRFPGP